MDRESLSKAFLILITIEHETQKVVKHDNYACICEQVSRFRAISVPTPFCYHQQWRLAQAHKGIIRPICQTIQYKYYFHFNWKLYNSASSGGSLKDSSANVLPTSGSSSIVSILSEIKFIVTVMYNLALR